MISRTRIPVSELSVERLDFERLPPGSARAFRLLMGSPSGWGEAWVPVWVLTGRQPRPRVTVTAGVHGDEFEGVRAIAQLARSLAPESLAGTVVLAPIINPPAYRAGTRHTPPDGLNLNRVFPGDHHGTPTERLAERLMQLLVEGSDLLVDLHSGGTTLLHAPLAGYYSLPGDVGERSRAAARALGLRYLWNLPERAGVLSFEAAKAGVPAVGTEIGGGARCLASDVALTRETVLGALYHMAVVPGEPAPNDEAEVVSGDWLLAEASGLFEPSVGLEQRVAADESLGAIFDPFGEVVARVRAPAAGVVLGLRSFPTVTAGELVAFVPQPGENRIPPARSL